MNNAPSFWKNIQRRSISVVGGDFLLFFFGIAIGLLNGFFGSGGGILAVALLEKKGLSPRQAHATSIALILPLSIISLGVYYFRGNLSLGQSLFFFVPALLGSVCGAWCLKRIPVFLLKISFSILILYSAAKILLT